MQLAKYKYLLFDLDDTLLDFTSAEKWAFKKILQDAQVEYSDEIFKTYKKINKELWEKYEKGEIENSEVINTRFKKFFKELGKDVDGVFYDEKYRDYLSLGEWTFDRVKNTLEVLAKTHKLYIATNGVSITQHTRLKNNDIKKYFTEIFISSEIGYKKPEKEYFDFIFNKIGSNNKNEYLMIGDNLKTDILGGVMAGIDTCFINAKKKEKITDIIPTYEIEKVSEML